MQQFAFHRSCLALVACGSWALAAAAGCQPSAPAQEPESSPEPSPQPGEVPWAKGDEQYSTETREVLPEPKSYDQPIDPGQDPGLSTTNETGVCQGKLGETARQAITARASNTRECYQALLKSDAEAEGRVRVSLRIGPGGEMNAVSVVQDTVEDATFTACVKETMDGPVRPAPTGGCVVVLVPLKFQQKQPEDGTPESNPGSDQHEDGTPESNPGSDQQDQQGNPG